MARLLVQLKLRLVLNALRSSTAAETSFILCTFFAVVVAVGVLFVLALFRGLSVSVDLTTVIFSAFALGWPAHHPGGDSTTSLSCSVAKSRCA